LKDKVLYDTSHPPLHRFIEALQQGGIGVTPLQVAAAHRVLLHYAPQVPNLLALAPYLCPIFATNEVEQKRFHEIFVEHFVQQTAGEGQSKKTATKPPPKWWIYLLGALMILLLVIAITYFTQPDADDELYISNKITDIYGGNEGTTFVVGDSLQATTRVVSNDSIKATKSVIKAIYDWGDGTPVDSSGRHVYTGSGYYTTRATVSVFYDGAIVKKETLTERLDICDFRNDATITTNATNDSIPLLKPLRMILELNSFSRPYRIEWRVRREKDAESVDIATGEGSYPDNKLFVWSAEEEGAYIVDCKVQYDSLDNSDPCTYTVTKLIEAYNPNKPPTSAILQPAANTKTLLASYGVKPMWFIILGGLLLLSMILAGRFIRRYQRLKRAGQESPPSKEEYEKWLASFASNQPVADLPFRYNHHLAPPEADMANIARLMRRRIAGEANYLHVGKTVAKAVRNNGFFQPVYEPRTRPSEYLLLIEESHLNSQQTRLFEYIADLMRRHNVLVEKYYYRYEPSLCYNHAAPRGVSLERLSEQYPGHVLLLAGHGHQLLYPYQPMVSTAYQSLLSRWQHRAIVTPVPYPDWGPAEKQVLPTVIPVFPADLAGLQAMATAQADARADVTAMLQEAADEWYGMESLDAADIGELSNYCAAAGWANSADGNPYNNVLFQWIAALAVYPKLQWELTLAIGKALLDAAGQGHQLNYTNLLRLTRLQWMKEGFMPPALRLELLKKLSRPNEVMARETILQQLAAIPNHEVKPGDAAYEERETQRIINEFNLYAYDPVKYAAYARSKTLFEWLWKDNKVMEAAVKQYLRNPGAQWPTLINNRLSNQAETADHVPLEDYFRPLSPSISAKAKLYRVLGTVMSVLTGLSMLALLGLLILQLSGARRFPLLTKQQEQWHDITFTIKDSTDRKQVKEVVVRVGESFAAFTGTGKLRLPINDSNQVVSVAVDDKVVFDTFMPIDRDRYQVVVKSKQPDEPVKTGLLLTLMTNPACNKSAEGERMGEAIMALDSTVWQNIRLLNTDNISLSPACLSEIRIGPGISAEATQALMGQFKQAGFIITLRPGGIPLKNPVAADGKVMGEMSDFMPLRMKQAEYFGRFDIAGQDTVVMPGEREVIISGKSDITLGNIPESAKQPEREIYVSIDSNFQQPTVKKPVVYIQISDASMMWSAQQFRKELRLKGYDAKVPEVKDWNYNSEIYYFDKRMEKAALEVQKLYRSFYPALPLKARLRQGNDPRPKDNRIVVWMKQLEKIGPVQQIGQEGQNENSLNAVIGKRIVNIAQKEIGYGETPPGSNKTKYGQWFNPDLNEKGIPWSAIFVAWVYDQAGHPLQLEKKGKGFASYAHLLEYAKTQRLMVDEPVQGDIFILDRIKLGYHGGIFVRWIDKAAGTFETVEGNTATDKNEASLVDKGVRSIKTQKIYFIHYRRQLDKASNF
jgi:hypothetical protein